MARTEPLVGQGLRARIARTALRLRDKLVLALHGLALRLDLVPPEFGREAPVDESDAREVIAEWVRYGKLWAGYNPEEVFALKVGGALLLAAVVAVWLLVGMLT